MIEIKNSIGNVIHTSQNLRGIVAHNRRQIVELCHIAPLSNGGAIVTVLWKNGDSCVVKFADFGVAKLWASKNHGIKASGRIIFP
jgi:hypothetical protein